MLHYSYGNAILNGLLAQGSSQISFSNTGCFLGLLTECNVSTDTFREPTDSVYRRVDLTQKSRITGNYFLTDAKTDSEENKIEVDGYEVKPAYVTNLSPIQFDEAQEDWHIVGFAIFDTASSKTPILYGQVEGEDGSNTIVIQKGNVPIIRKGSLKISLA